MGRRKKVDGTEETEVAEPTFAEAKGSEANQQAKKIAQEKSKKAKTPAFTFYTKNGNKVLKLSVKQGKTHSVYIGNYSTKKNKAQLDPLIKQWKSEGVWLEESDRKEKIAAAQAKLPPIVKK